MMTTKTFLTVHGTIYGLFAFALFFLPSILWPYYGLQINDQYALFLSQHNSIFLGGIAALSFLFRDAAPGSDVERRIILGLLITNLLGVAITLYACIIGTFSGFGWSDPVFFAVLVVLSMTQLRKTKKPG